MFGEAKAKAAPVWGQGFEGNLVRPDMRNSRRCSPLRHSSARAHPFEGVIPREGVLVWKLYCPIESLPRTMAAPSKKKLHVTKTLEPGQPGAIKLAQQYGSALLCVRYRQDAARLTRYTTVELVVDEAQVAPKSGREVGVQIGYLEATLQAKARSVGAKWDKQLGLWRMPLSAAYAIGLGDRVKRLRHKT